MLTFNAQTCTTQPDQRLTGHRAGKAMLLAVLPLVAGVALANETKSTEGDMSQQERSIEQEMFGSLEDGREVALYTLTNAEGASFSVTPYGGTIVALKVPDAEGNVGDVVLGFNSLDDYRSPAYRQANPYFGALIGRYGNRIADGRFTLDGKTYRLPTNDGDNHLHGGDTGFDRRLWQAETVEDERGVGIILTLTSADGDQGYPGELQTRVRYTLSDDNALTIDYRATADAATPVNLTQHSYFNLDGVSGQEAQGHDILGHRLMIDADRFTPVDEGLIPTGEMRDVAGTPFDFREATAIGERIDSENTQLSRGQGYDHNFVLNADRSADGELTTAARVVAENSGRVMEVQTTEPGLQFYSGNFLDGSLTGKSGTSYGHRFGLALETQHFPDSPNQDGFPSTILKPGEVYESRTRYVFSTTSTHSSAD
ncbi:aldose epimerase family protein [Halomonas sabkhae]|uniref:aldose epimerase family protein n=1 Tax=Halomonas sabkhae TaxID=626223 RepID=UPI0025B5FA88|nr:aldose epimerase family protein [Halomonas sabkhae]MDN3526282.1 aldose epimerase family protein [Halomonas sabkhae]